MEQMHSLLKRQLRRSFGDQFNIPKEWQEFIDTVNDAYQESDMDRGMLERSLELSSQELIQANSEMRAIFQAIPDLLFRLDCEGRILNYKAGATTDLMVHPKELLGKRIQDVPLKQVSEKFSEAIQQTQESKTIINIEYSLFLQNQPLFFEARLVPLPEDQIVVIIRNITERIRMEEALREVANKFRFVFENAYDGLSIFEETPVREHRRLIDCNKRYAEMAGRSREELLQIGITKNIAITLSEENQESNMHDSVFSGSYSWIRPDGKDNVIEYTAVPIKVQGKTITIGIDRDITERKRAEEALRESEERYRCLVQASPDAIAVHAEGKIVYVSPAAVKLAHAHDESELIGKPILDVVHPDYKDFVHQRAIATMEQVVAQPMAEEKFLCLDGTVVDVEVVSVPTTFKGMPAVQVIARDITERKHVEESLRRERNLFRVLIDNLPDAIYVKDTECRKTVANVADVRNMGKKSEAEVLGKTDFDLYPKDIATGFYEDDRFVIQSGHSLLNKEEFFFDKDGKKRWLLTFKIPMRNEHGQIIGLVGIGREITEQKRAMEALTLLSHTVKCIGESISITDLKNNLLFVNEAFLKTYGYTEQEIIGKSINIVSCDPMIHEQTILAETIKGSWQGELLNRKKDGTLFPIFLSTSVVYDEKEQPIGLVGVATDITERKQAEEALQESQALYRSFVEHLPASVFRKDSKGRYVFVNSLFCQFKGLTIDEVLGKTPHELAAFESAEEATRPSIMTAIQHMLPDQGEDNHEMIMRTGKPIEMEEVYPQRDGTTRYFHVVKSPVFTSDGKIIGTQGVQFDITELKRAEEALHKREEAQRFFSERLTNLLYTINELSKIESFDELCRRSVELAFERIGFDRVGLCFLSEDRQTLLGVYGTDETGHLRNEKHLKRLITQTPTVAKLLENREPVIFFEEEVLYNDKIEQVGIGHHAVTRLWDGEKIIGIYAVDNLVHRKPITDEDLKILEIYGSAMGHRFTLKRAEEELQKERNLLRTVIDNLPDGIYTKDLNCRKTLTNRTDVYNMGRTSEAEVLGKDDYELFPKKMADAFIADDRSVIQTGQPVINREEYVVDAKGQKHFLLTTKLPFRDEQGQIIGLIGIGHDITERKRAEEALQESDEKLRNIVEHSTNLFYSRNTDQVFTYLSPQTKDIFDCEPDEALVQFTDFMTDNSINKLGCELAEKAVRTGARQEAYELELISRKGRRVWVEIQEAPVVKDGKTISIVGAATDITERRWAEMALQVSEKKYRDMITWAPIGIYQSTRSGKLLSVNKSLMDLLGYENVNELMECNMGKDVFYDEKERNRLIARHDTYQENMTLHTETRWKTKNGSIIWVLMTVRDVRDKTSEILYYEGFVFDITERKHAEESLRESEERYRLLVENSTDIVTEINAEDKYLYVSPNVKSILDFEPLDLVGTNVLSRVYGKDKAIIGEILSKLGGSATYRYRDRVGGLHWFESSGRVYYTSSGEQRMVMVSRDITQRRKAEQELEFSRKQLQHFTEHLEHVLEEERKRISRELHDELGQLLTILKFDLSWLKLEGIQSDANIFARIDAMMESVNEALASVKRISKEIRPPQLEALGLIGAIQWDLDQVEKKTGLKGIVSVEPVDIEIKGQVNTVLYRVFREALTNILRHANADHAFIRLSQRLDTIILTIRDDGRGVTKKELKGTTSLGLVGIRERLRMVGGTFTIEGKTGSGTVLSVEVPLKKKGIGERKS
jgi:PAS domain S-box-containing protein